MNSICGPRCFNTFLQYQVEQLSISQLAGLVAHRLDELSRWAKVMGEEDHAQAVEGLWHRFDFIASDSSATVEEFDDALEELYDWADTPAGINADGQLVRGGILCRVQNDSTV